MLVSLNVAINSYDYTLLSLLISNQFVEIKGSVFKKFEKENLFQIMCAGKPRSLQRTSSHGQTLSSASNSVSCSASLRFGI